MTTSLLFRVKAASLSPSQHALEERVLVTSLPQGSHRQTNKFTLIFTPTGNLQFPVELTWMSLDKLFAQLLVYICETLRAELTSGVVNKRPLSLGDSTLCLINSLRRTGCL